MGNESGPSGGVAWRISRGTTGKLNRGWLVLRAVVTDSVELNAWLEPEPQPFQSWSELIRLTLSVPPSLRTSGCVKGISTPAHPKEIGEVGKVPLMNHWAVVGR